MRLAHVIPSLEDRHGGPSKSVRALANAMAAAGHRTELLTTLEPGQPMSMADGERADVHVFPREFPRRLSRSRGLRARLLGESYECVHNHALWLLPLRYSVEAARRRTVPLVISPRGMMSGWAWTHHRLRKYLATHLVHPGAFEAAAGWHATSAEEAEDIRRLGFRQPICVAPNGVEIPDESSLASASSAWEDVRSEARGRRIALFYSRFHRKKRLRELIQLWAAAPRREWFLLIAGLPEEYPVEEVRSWIEAAGLVGGATVVDGRGRPPPYAIASLFLLPSHSENFGLVIAEALAAGVPALVTDTTPWLELAARDAGACVAWDGYRAALDRHLAAAPEELLQRGRNGWAWMQAEFTWAVAAQRLLDFYPTLRHG